MGLVVVLQRFRVSLQREELVVTRECECGASLESMRSSARFCSSTCRARATRRRQAQIAEASTVAEAGSSTSSWPPAPVPGDWRLERLRVKAPGTFGGSAVYEFAVREVKLWGQLVLIDEDDLVYCPDCWSFLSVTVLGRPYQAHRVGVPRPSGIRLIPMHGDDESGREQPWHERGF